MTATAMRSVPAFMPEALTASQVGTWRTDCLTDRTVADSATAALFGLDPEQAAEGLPLAAFAQAIHHEDLRPFYDKLDSVRVHGGLFVVEYRTHPAPGLMRWILARGRYERDDRTGEMMGRGIVIDITESKLDGHVEDRAFFLAAGDDAGESPLVRAADHAIAAREAIDQAGSFEGHGLRKAVDALLWAVGRALARRSVS